MNIDDITYIKKLEEDQGINILSYNSIKEDLSNDNYSYFICKMSEEIVGYIAISHVIDTMDILSIVVKGNYHRLGIATYIT